MKELSIEEKAKRYDEILARATGAYLPYYTEDIMTKVKEFVDYLIHELKESEDERIRKELIAFLKENHETGRADETWSLSGIERWIAWLEKQGEQNLIMAKSPQLGERKPTWSEEDEVMIKIFDSIIRYIVEVVDKDVLERFGTKREELFSWLKSLKDRVQPKQEWSEEEEENFKKAIRVLKVNNFHHTADMLQEMKYKLIPREKANWKPSDEQMKTLQEVIDVGYFTSYPNSLETLYEQLKKLKGE